MLDFLINNLITSLSSSMHSRDEVKLTGEELKLYVNNLYDKLRLTKNILFKNKPIDFYDNYVPLKLRLGEQLISTQNPFSFLYEYRKVAILGSAGSGKTTLLKHIALMCIDDGSRIPVFLELRNFNEERYSFEEYVTKSISEKVSINELFKKGEFIFILDGFDEINFSEGKYVISQIEKFISKYSNNIFIISSRPGTNIESLLQFFVFEIEPLNQNDISLFVKKLELTSKVRNNFNYHLNEDEILHQYLTNPLFLSLYINYINYHSYSDMPSKKTVFFRNILDTLFSQHDAVSKLGFVRDKLSGLNKDELETVSSILAFRALISSSKSFSTDNLYNELQLIKKSTGLSFENENIIYDLTITVNILINDSGYFNFTHIAFLEYLASLFISRLPLKNKEKVYGQFLKSNKVYYSTSFLTFLYELDYKSFIQFFILPFIEQYSDSNIDSIDYSKNQILEFLIFTFRKNMDNDYLKYNYLQEIYNDLISEINSNNDENIDELLRF